MIGIDGQRSVTSAQRRQKNALQFWVNIRTLSTKKASSPGARVNPLAFLSGTTLRFVTLTVVALATTWDSWQVIGGTILGSPYRTALDRCLEGIATAIQINDVLLGPITGAEQSSVSSYATRACANSYATTSTIIALTAVASLIVGTLALFLYWPSWYKRHYRLIPFPFENFELLGGEVKAFAEKDKISPEIFLLDTADFRVAGRAFGRPGRRYIVLSRGLTVLYSKNPGAARAVIAHELAHLRNGDVDPGYVAVWTWRVFVAVTIIPMTLWVSWSVVEGHFGIAWTYGWRTAAAAILGFVIRGWLFRFREFLADAKADSGGVHEIENLLSRESNTTRRRRISEWFSLHPTPQQRIDLIKDPRMLMKTGFWESFAVGAIAMLASDIADMVAAILGLHSSDVVYFGAAGTIMIFTWSITRDALRTALSQRFEEDSKYYTTEKRTDLWGGIGVWFILAVLTVEAILSAFKIHQSILPTFAFTAFFTIGVLIFYRIMSIVRPGKITEDTVTPTYLLPGIRVGLGASLGLLAGRFIALSPTANTDVGHTMTGISSLFEQWGIWVFLVSFFMTTWCYLAARIWIPVIAQAARPHLAALIVLSIFFLAMLPWLPRLMANYYFYANIPWELAGIPGKVAASLAFSETKSMSPDAEWVAQVGAIILSVIILVPQIRRGARAPQEWVTLDPKFLKQWNKPAHVQTTAFTLSILVAFIGSFSSDFNPGPWPGLNVTAMALSPTSPANREFIPGSTIIDKTGDQDLEYQMLSLGYFDGRPLHFDGIPIFGVDISRQDLVIYSKNGITWWRAYVFALPGDEVTSAGGGAPILVDGSSVGGSLPGDEESTSLQPLHLKVPAGEIWVTGVHWNLAASNSYYIGEPGGGLIDQKWVAAYETPGDFGRMCDPWTSECLYRFFGRYFVAAWTRNLFADPNPIARVV